MISDATFWIIAGLEIFCVVIVLGAMIFICKDIVRICKMQHSVDKMKLSLSQPAPEEFIELVSTLPLSNTSYYSFNKEDGISLSSINTAGVTGTSKSSFSNSQRFCFHNSFISASSSKNSHIELEKVVLEPFMCKTSPTSDNGCLSQVREGDTIKSKDSLTESTDTKFILEIECHSTDFMKVVPTLSSEPTTIYVAHSNFDGTPSPSADCQAWANVVTSLSDIHPWIVEALSATFSSDKNATFMSSDDVFTIVHLGAC